MTPIFSCARRFLEDGEVGLFLVDVSLPGVSIRPLGGFLTDSFEVRLEDVKVADTALMPGGWESLDLGVIKALPLLAAYQVGACERVFEMTLEYANSRVQFGLPIGRFQRVQDHVIPDSKSEGRCPVDHLRGVVEAG